MNEDWRVYPPLRLSPVLTAALAEIAEHGYHGTSVRRIATRAGVTVPGLYYHFANKQDILLALLDQAMGIVLTHAEAALEEAGENTVDRFRALVEAIARFQAQHSDLAFMDTERRSLTPENRQAYIARRDTLEQHLTKTIQAGVAQGVFSTPYPAECSRAILAMCQGIAGWYRADGSLTPGEVALRYVGIALAAAGHEEALS